MFFFHLNFSIFYHLKRHVFFPHLNGPRRESLPRDVVLEALVKHGVAGVLDALRLALGVPGLVREEVQLHVRVREFPVLLRL